MNMIVHKKINSTRFFSTLGLSVIMMACGQRADFSLAPESQSFAQNVKYNDEVDILWVIDDSETMGDHQANLASQFNYFMDALIATKLNYHVSVISTDRGAHQGNILGSPKVITAATANPKQAFATNVRIGTGGSPAERGLLAMKDALSTPKATTGANVGFLRPGAQLVVIFLSDENDESVDSPTEYINFLNKLKPDFTGGGKAWAAHFIGALNLSPECTAYGPHARPGLRYMELVNYSGGVNESICTSDLSRALTNVQKRIVERVTEYRLDREPVPGSIVVRINGVVIPENATNGWKYFSSGRVVRFYGSAVPAADSFVNVDYQPIGIK